MRPKVNTVAITGAIVLSPLGALAAGPALEAFSLAAVMAGTMLAMTASVLLGSGDRRIALGSDPALTSAAALAGAAFVSLARLRLVVSDALAHHALRLVSACLLFRRRPAGFAILVFLQQSADLSHFIVDVSEQPHHRHDVPMIDQRIHGVIVPA